MKSPSPIQWMKDGEKISPTQWVWQAFYDDGSSLEQYDKNGVYHQFREIDQERLTLFRMKRFDDSKHYDLIFEKGMKLIHFYRNYLLDNGQFFSRTFCFGYERGKEKLLITILPNDDIIISNDDINLNIKTYG